MPTYERERRSTPPEPEVPAGTPNWAVLGLLLLVLVMGAGAVGLAVSGYAWI